MNIIIYFNYQNISNSIDKIIFNQYYPSHLFENYDPNILSSEQKLSNKIKLLHLNSQVKNSSCLPTFCITTIEDPFSESDLIKLFDAEYMMFLKSKFFKKKALLEYFDKYNIVYLNYAYKEKIIYTLKMINFFIKNATTNDKIKFISTSGIHNLNHIFFPNNDIEPNILYKKISFSNQDLFLPFNTYAIKKIEYKLRTFCQIAEKLGAETIKIKYDSKFLSDNQLKINVNALSNNVQVQSDTNTKNLVDNTIDLEFKYPNNNSNLTLNKFNVINLIVNESEFFIQSEEFDADIDLKFLIDARCINLIQKYNTNFVINCMNEIEQNIMLKVQDYGINGSYISKTSNNVQININIDFIDIYANPSCINGSNIYMEKEGFDYLMCIINEEIKHDNRDFIDLYSQKLNVYKKINNFLRSHLEYKTIQKNNSKNIKSNNLLANTDNHLIPYLEYQNLLETYQNIIEQNFNEDEQKQLFYDYFDNNLNYYNFEIFKNILTCGSKKRLDKLSFISIQYHIINKYKYHIINFILKQIKKIGSYFNVGININQSVNLHRSNNSTNTYNQIKLKKIKTSFEQMQKINQIIDLVNSNPIVDKLFVSELFKTELDKYIINLFEKLITSPNGLMFCLCPDKLNDELNKILFRELNTQYLKQIALNIISDDIISNNSNHTDIYNTIDKLISIYYTQILDEITEYNRETMKLIELEFDIIKLSESLDVMLTLYDYLLILYYDFLSEYLDKIHLTYGKMKQLNIKFKNNIPKNEIPKSKVIDNYNRFCLFYTWNDFNNTLQEYIMIDQLPYSTESNLIPISYSRLTELMFIDKLLRGKFKLVPDNCIKNNVILYYGPLYLPGLTFSNYTKFNNIDPNAEIEIHQIIEQNPMTEQDTKNKRLGRKVKTHKPKEIEQTLSPSEILLKSIKKNLSDKNVSKEESHLPKIPVSRPISINSNKSSDSLKPASSIKQKCSISIPHQTVSSSVNRQRAVSPVLSPSMLSSPIQQRAASPVPVQQRAASPVPVQQRAASPVQQRAASPVPVQQRAASPIQQRAASPVPVQQRAASPLPFQQNTYPSSSIRQKSVVVQQIVSPQLVAQQYSRQIQNRYDDPNPIYQSQIQSQAQIQAKSQAQSQTRYNDPYSIHSRSKQVYQSQAVSTPRQVYQLQSSSQIYQPISSSVQPISSSVQPISSSVQPISSSVQPIQAYYSRPGVVKLQMINNEPSVINE
jgi:hypothetical protein